MSPFHTIGRGAISLALLLIMTSLCCALPTQAEGGFALSGSFYAQEFELPQGSSLKAPDVFVVVFNNTDGDFRVRMVPQAPVGVKLILSEEDFLLRAGEQRKIEVGVEVSADASPGEHEVSVTAEPYREGDTGIQIMGAAGQSARLVVVGESASARLQTVSPEGGPVQGVIRLFKIMAGQRYEVAYSETGVIEATIAPGSYVAVAYIAGEELAQESFEVAADEQRTVSLPLETVYFESFGLVPNYGKATNELAFAQVVYTIKNLYRPVQKADVVLHVSLDGATFDEVTLVTLSPLEKGRVGLNYNYVSSEGWRSGTYSFKLELLLDGNSYATTLEKRLSVAGPSEPSEPSEATGATEPVTINLELIGGVVAAVAVIAGAGYGLVVRRRKK